MSTRIGILTDAEVDRQLHELEDIEIPCEANRHEGPDPAAWIVRQVVCCPRVKPIGMICDPCLQHYLGLETPVRHDACGRVTTPGRHTILSFERIDRRPT